VFEFLKFGITLGETVTTEVYPGNNEVAAVDDDGPFNTVPPQILALIASGDIGQEPVLEEVLN
jgi:hypothetical protein